MAVTFSGTTPTYLSTTNVPASQTIKGSPFTFAMWVYCTSSGGIVTESAFSDVGVYMGIVGSGISGSTYTDSAVLSNSASIGTFYLDIEQNSFAEEMPIQGNSTTANTWVHYAATYDGSNTTGGCKIYQNGAPVTPASTSNNLSSTVAWNRIIVGGFNGAGQDAWMWNRVLSAAEISLLYSGGRQAAISYTSLVGHWPLFNGGSAGVDFSGNGRNLTATGTITDSTLQAPRPFWWGRRPTIILPAVSALAITPAGTTQTTGSVTLGASEALALGGTTQTTGSVAISALMAVTPAGTTNTSGAVALTELAAISPAGTTNTAGTVTLTAAEALATAGTTNTTGAVALTSLEALAPAGTTNTTGAVTLTSLEALAPAGTTNVTGAVALGLTAPIAPAGTTNVTGAVTLGELAALAPGGLTSTTGSVTLGSSAGLALAPAGTTNTTGAVTLGESAAIAPSGSTQTTGAVALTALEAVQPAGTTNTTGVVSLGMTAPLATPAGSTQTAGFVALGQLLQLTAAGTTNTTGAVAFTELAALAPTGTTNTTGSFAMGKVIAFPAGGITSCFGSVTLSGGTAPTVTGGPFKGNVSRRTMYAGRRRMRVV